MRRFQAFVYCFLVYSLTLNGILGQYVDFEGWSEYDPKLENFYTKVFEKIREKMVEGYPELGIPPNDPLSLPNFDLDYEDALHPIYEMSMRFRHSNMTGLSKYQIDKVQVSDADSLTFQLSLPELTIETHCYMDGKMFNFFPYNREGPLYVHLKDVKLDGSARSELTTDFEIWRQPRMKLNMRYIWLNIEYGSLEIESGNLFTGYWEEHNYFTELKKILREKLFKHFGLKAEDQIMEGFRKLINNEMGNRTLAQILD